MVDAYYCTSLIAAAKCLGIAEVIINRYVEPDDYIREHPPRNVPRRLALTFMRDILKLPVTYYSWGKGGWVQHIVGLEGTFLAGVGEFRLGRRDCDLGLLRRVDVTMGRGPHIVWMLSGWEHELSSDFPAIFSRINRRFRRLGYVPVIKQHPSFRLPRGVRGKRNRRIPRYVPGDLIRFPKRTIIVGMFSTAMTTYPDLTVFSIAGLCRAKNEDLFSRMTDDIRRLNDSVRFVESVEEVINTVRHTVDHKGENRRIRRT